MGEVKIADVLAQAVGRGVRKNRTKDRHSRLFTFLWKHHAEMAAGLEQPGAPTWDDLEVAFAELVAQGHPVRDGNGKPPSSAMLRKTWWKVCRAKAREAAPVGKPSKISGPVVLKPDSAAPADPTAAVAEEDFNPSRTRFGMARPRT